MKKAIFMVLVVNQLFLLSATVSAQSSVLPGGGGHLASVLSFTTLFDSARHALVRPRTISDSLEAWKKWKTVDNYSFGKDRGNMPMIADLEALHPYFRDKVKELIRLCALQRIQLAVVETYRTPAKQSQYYSMGDQFTNSKGGQSRHQYGLAVDVVPVVRSVAVWNNRRLWQKIGAIGESLGLRWGGRWRVLYDPGHFEWSGGLSKEELAGGTAPEIPADIIHQYPHLDKELEQLRMYWQAWGARQSAGHEDPL